MPTPTTTPATADHVVLLDEGGRPVGTAPRATVHGRHTPLHLAFSCYVFRPDGALLMTRRALAKRAFPGIWTNSFCGHPRSGEPTERAIERYARHELGVSVTDVTCVLPDFRYRATDASGIVENEICPVYLATTSDEPVPDPSEVMDLAWVSPESLGRTVVAAPWALSPWTVEQVRELADLDDVLTGPVTELAG